MGTSRFSGESISSPARGALRYHQPRAQASSRERRARRCARTRQCGAAQLGRWGRRHRRRRRRRRAAPHGKRARRTARRGRRSPHRHPRAAPGRSCPVRAGLRPRHDGSLLVRQVRTTLCSARTSRIPTRQPPISPISSRRSARGARCSSAQYYVHRPHTSPSGSPRPTRVCASLSAGSLSRCDRDAPEIAYGLARAECQLPRAAVRRRVGRKGWARGAHCRVHSDHCRARRRRRAHDVFRKRGAARHRGCWLIS